MTTIVLIGVASALVLFAIVLKVRAKPKKAEKWEKAQIVKRLVALSENEDKANGISRLPSSTPRRRATAAGASGSHAVRPASG